MGRKQLTLNELKRRAMKKKPHHSKRSEYMRWWAARRILGMETK